MAQMDTGSYDRGSSPRGRGTASEDLRVVPIKRFIPAWAGNSFGVKFVDAVAAVHPRVGGEQWRDMQMSIARHGSSPRGRGTGGFAG